MKALYKGSCRTCIKKSDGTRLLPTFAIHVYFFMIIIQCRPVNGLRYPDDTASIKALLPL